MGLGCFRHFDRFKDFGILDIGLYRYSLKNLLIEIKEIEPFVSVSKITINKSEFSKKIASTAEVELVGIPNALAQASEARRLSKSKSAA